MKVKRVLLLSLVVSAAFAIVAVMNRQTVRKLHDQVLELEKDRLELLKEKYEFSWTIPEATQIKEMKLIYDDIIAAYTNEDLVAMCKSISSLPNVHCHLQWQVASEVKSSFVRVLNESFLRSKELRNFTTRAEFDRYAIISLEAARFYGESEIQRKCFDYPIGVEYLALRALQHYVEKFHKEGRDELENAAMRQREYWIARIESQDGLTRQCARHALEYNTIYIKALKPERALTKEQGILQARQTAKGLINCGYTPKWLDVEFPAVPSAK